MDIKIIPGGENPAEGGDLNRESEPHCGRRQADDRVEGSGKVFLNLKHSRAWRFESRKLKLLNNLKDTARAKRQRGKDAKRQNGSKTKSPRLFPKGWLCQRLGEKHFFQ